MIRFIEAYQYQAIIDNRTTLFCESHDGQVIKASDGELTFINPPNHFNCRSLITPIFVFEESEESKKIALRPPTGFGG